MLLVVVTRVVVVHELRVSAVLWLLVVQLVVVERICARVWIVMRGCCSGRCGRSQVLLRQLAARRPLALIGSRHVGRIAIASLLLAETSTSIGL